MIHDDYRQIKAMNWSTLKTMAVSPRHYRWAQDHPSPSKPSFDLGTACHLAVLEPDRYDDACVTRPEEWDSWRTKASQEWRAEQIEAGRLVLDDDMAQTVQSVARAVSEHQDAMDRLAGTRREETIRWTIDGVDCKGRLDAVASDRIIDLKTARDLEPRAFATAFAKYLYHGQLAFYLDGAIAAGACSPDANAYIIAVETQGPYDVAVFRIGRDTIEAGRVLYRRLIDSWITCTREGVWPGRYPSTTMFDAPPWADGMQGEEDQI